jgi:hypothetical protein
VTNLSIETTESSLVIRVPVRVYLLRSIAAIILLPLLFALLIALVFLQLESETPSGIYSVLFAVWLALAGASELYGFTLLGLSGWLSKKSIVRFDRETGWVSGRSMSGAISSFQSLRLRPKGRSGGFGVLELLGEGGRVFTVNARVRGFQSKKTQEIVQRLRSWCGYEDAPQPIREAGFVSDGDRSAAMLCYLPIEGIFLFVSAYQLFAAKRDSFVGFCARQSLWHFAFTVLALLLPLLGLGIPLSLAPDGPMRSILMPCLIVVLSVLYVWCMGSRIYACFQAWKGRAWRMPWLKRLVKPWPAENAESGN